MVLRFISCFIPIGGFACCAALELARYDEVYKPWRTAVSIDESGSFSQEGSKRFIADESTSDAAGAGQEERQTKGAEDPSDFQMLVSRATPSFSSHAARHTQLRLRVDLFFAFDTGLAHRNFRAQVKRWMADVRSMGKFSVGHRFFCDGDLSDLPSSQFVIQPEANRRPQGEPAAVAWVKRWLFDMSWALEHVDFKGIIRADDDGFQCAGALADLVQVLEGLSQSDLIMVYSSDEYRERIDKKKGLSRSVDRWPLATGENFPDFEENWVLLSKPLLVSLMDLANVQPPGDHSVLAHYFQNLSTTYHWPPSDTVILDVGRFDSHGKYSACEGQPAGECKQGWNMWDTHDHGACMSYEACAQHCQKDGLLWLHHVLFRV